MALLVGAIIVLGIPAACIIWLGQPPPPPPGRVDVGLFEPPPQPGVEPPAQGGVPVATEDKDSPACTRILAIDGGGVRGLIPAVILAEIEKRIRKPIWQSFDVIAGASTGAVLALGLTRPSDADVQTAQYTAQHIVTLYTEHAATIFPLRNRMILSVQQLLRPKYRADDAERMIRAGVSLDAAA